MTKIHKIVLNNSDLSHLAKYKALRFDRYIIKVDDSFSIPQVKVFGEFKS